METKNIYTNNPQILPLTESLYACAVILIRWMHSAAENGVAETHIGTVRELTDTLIKGRRNLQFALSGGIVLNQQKPFTEHETKPLPYSIERELRWILFQADCISINLIHTIQTGFDEKKIMSYARQLEQFADEIRTAKGKIKKNIRKNAQNEELSSGMPIPDPTPTALNLTDPVDEPCGLDPDYRHHDLCPDAQDTSWLHESIRRNAHIALGIGNLVRRTYQAEGDNEANRDDVYYSMLSVRMLFQDISALVRDWTDKAAKNGTTVNAEAMAEINAITIRSIDTLSLFIDLLAGVGPVTTLQVMDVLDSITSEISGINAVIDFRRGKSKKQQA